MSEPIVTKQGKKAYKKAFKKYQQSEQGKKVFARNSKKWVGTEKGKAYKRKYAFKLYHKNKKINPQMIKARSAVSNAIKTKKLKPSNEYKCVLCHSKQAHDYHHVDYNRPFLVFPVCRICHIEFHKLYA